MYEGINWILTSLSSTGGVGSFVDTPGQWPNIYRVSTSATWGATNPEMDDWAEDASGNLPFNDNIIDNEIMSNAMIRDDIMHFRYTPKIVECSYISWDDLHKSFKDPYNKPTMEGPKFTFTDTVNFGDGWGGNMGFNDTEQQTQYFSLTGTLEIMEIKWEEQHLDMIC